MDWIIGDSDMIEDVDVVVVGAGPAGSTAAEHAALNGAEVVLLERRDEIGYRSSAASSCPQ
jgi:digeranylgeranylglycerophospholipid reductase